MSQETNHTAQLLRTRRFGPLFWAGFLGAFNDNFLKNAIVMLVAYQGLTVWGLKPEAMATAAPALLVLPYFLFSAIAGQLSDRLPKAGLLARVKLIEIVLAVVAAAGFVTNHPAWLLISLFLLGVQATFFGPAKYSIMPQLLAADELVAGNALSEMGTNLAILLGTVAGGVLVAQHGVGPQAVGAGVIGVAIAGWLCARLVPHVPAESPDLEVKLNPLTTTWEIVAEASRTRPLLNAILAISWFWLYGAAMLGLFVPYAKNSLHAGETVVTLFLAVFSVGVAAGSLICEKLSFGRLELGLVPFGSIGLSLFALDIALTGGLPAPANGGLIDIAGFMGTFTGQRLAFDMFMLAFCGGIYSVPLYTFLQVRSEASRRSRVVAALNIMAALFMTGWAVIQVELLNLMPVNAIFALLAVLNAAVAWYIYTVIPEFALRFAAYLLTRLIYRCRVDGLASIPEEGPAVIVCNHVSFIDWLIIAAAVKRPVRFVMYQGFAKLPVVGSVVQQAKVIPIASAKEDPDALSAAMDRIAAELEAGEVVCLFPEGKLTADGAVDAFKPGIERIIQRTPVPVIPAALTGLWGSFFSRKDGHAMTHPFRRFYSRIGLRFGAPVAPESVSATALHDEVVALRGTQA